MNQEPPISMIISQQSTIVHNYRYFYYLANELTHLALEDEDKNGINAFRYAMGVVIFSYTTIETFTNHIFHSKNYKINELFSSLSDELNEKIERFSLNEKIEFAFKFYPDSKIKELNKGEEPFQSFDILRQLRNFLIHYIPKEEVVHSDNKKYLDQLTKLEKKARSKFKIEDLASSKMAFVYRCFNKDCALWAFNLVQPFLNWLCDSLNIDRHELKIYWDLPPRA
ncbi:MAG: hypothetical protein ABR577_07430 [Pyrinomonadaceae bacterium]